MRNSLAASGISSARFAFALAPSPLGISRKSSKPWIPPLMFGKTHCLGRRLLHRLSSAAALQIQSLPEQKLQQ
ncbi:hypothetical protein KCU85_g327, partial [Aureobasidium melanogenum]